jgi:hypothetical protein
LPESTGRLSSPRGSGAHFFFDNHALDTDRRELHRGERIAVEPQVFGLLIYLLQLVGQISESVVRRLLDEKMAGYAFRLRSSSFGGRDR